MTMSPHGSNEDQSLPKIGDLIVGKYRIEKLIGKGGMGAVFAAQHELLGQRVAVKFLLGDIVTNQEAVQRFLNEARNAAKIQSEHVCRVMDVGTAENGLPYMVLEFLEGLDLSQRLEQHGPLGVEECVDYTLQALEAIAQAHALGIVHRDLKPANLFLAQRADGGTTIKVLDFGIAKASNPFGEGGNHSLTSTKSMLGSPLYMSPEQLRSAKNVDARADVWAIGVIMYELLTGTVPFNGETLGELFIAILEQPAPPVMHRRGDVPQILSEAISRSLVRAPEQRFQNVAELAQAIASCAPARSFASVERITSTLGMPRPSMVMPQPAAGHNPHAQSSGGYRPPAPSYVDPNAPVGPNTGSGVHNAPPQANTNGSWGNTAGGAQPPQSKAPMIVGIALVALVALGVSAGVVVKVVGNKSAATPPTSATTLTTTATIATTVKTADTATVTPTVDTSKTATPTNTVTVATNTPLVNTGHTTTTNTGTKPPASAVASAPSAKPAVTTPPTTTKPTNTAVDPFGSK